MKGRKKRTMLLPLRRLLILGIILVTLHSSHCQSQSCYNGSIPLRCEPLPETFSLRKLPIVNSTCGDPPNPYSLGTYISTSQKIVLMNPDTCCICNSSDPDNAHGPEMMTDFSDGIETWWQSENDVSPVSIQIDLGTPVQVGAILFNFISFKPKGFYIERSSDNGETFEPFHYLAHDCQEMYMIDPEKQLTSDTETDMLCQRLFSNPGGVSFVPSLNRPSTNDYVPGLSRELYDFITVTNIRVILDGYQFAQENITFYALNDLSVVGKCQCNGHASNCSTAIENDTVCECEHNTAGSNCERCKDLYNDLQWDIATGFEPFECKKCECNGHADSCEFNETLFQLSNKISGGMCIGCTDNTQGPKCDQCAKYFYPNLSLSPSEVNYCRACDCNTSGTMDDGVCERFDNSTIGQCMCKVNVMGRTCDTCKNGYFNLTPDNEDGCNDCGCDPMLSNDVSTCDPVTGTCSCRPNVIGDKCHTCAPGFYLTNPQTCSPCGCDSGGATTPVCDVTTGQCDCRNGVTGQTCRTVESNRYFPYIDHVVYEAEESKSGSFEYSYRLPTNNTENQYTGSGYIAIQNNSTVYIEDFTPPIGGQYDFVLRYRSIDALLWDRIELRLLFDSSMDDGSLPPSNCNEHSDPNHSYDYSNLPMAEVGAVGVTICLRKGRTYRIMVNGYDSDVTEALEIDSMVVLFTEPDGLSSLSDSSISTVYSNCLTQFKNLLTRENSILSQCEDVTFSIFTEIYNRTLGCDCSTSGSTTATCNEYGGQCTCKTLLNIGRGCGICAAGSYINNIDDDGCTDCSCAIHGSVDPFCDQITGQCNCYENVDNRICDACVPDTYNLQAGIGCTECNCNSQGSAVSQCHQNGTCICNSGIIGEKCDICDPENFNFPLCNECNCNAAGSNHLSCSIAGECSCRSNTMGLKCDSCTDGTFNLDQSNDEGCQPCYCSGINGATCVSADGYKYSIINTSFDQWMIDSESYFNAPNEYLGNRLTSYRQYLTLVATHPVNGDDGGSDYDILIEGQGNLLVANFTRRNTSTGLVLDVRFIENNVWFDLVSDLQVTAYQLQDTLTNLTSIRIDTASLGSSVLMSVSMDAASTEGSGSIAGWVEQCDCGLRYGGLSCEECADGYYRDSESGECKACQCNGHSSYCDKITGDCINCMNNTDGDSCEMCQEGYYGDPLSNVQCLPCECPFNNSKGQYSPTCQLDNDGTGINCTSCAEGHIGIQCESCDSGYFGDPFGKYGNSTKCTDCNCNGNNDVNDPNNCNRTTGICLKCLHNTDGDECENCVYGYYGDAITAKNCTDCQCNEWGSANPQCNSVGDCECNPNITGSKCTECIPHHYNSSEDGCGPCDCNPVGSYNQTCDSDTGQCNCKPNVGGRQCDICEIGYFNLGGNGCEACGCGSGAIDVSCTDDGVCNCTTGVVGDKCDQCAINYFIDGTQCNACPSCYNDVQSGFNSTTTHYIRLRLFMNSLMEQNSTSNFYEKLNISITTLAELNETVSALASQYGEFYVNMQDALFQTNQLDIDTDSLDGLIDPTEQKVSPYVNLVESAYLIVETLKADIYAGRDVLAIIENVIYPDIWSNTSYLNLLANQSNTTYLALVEYVDELKNQTATIHELVKEASYAVDVSMTTADMVSMVSDSNMDTLTMAQNIATSLNANISIAIQEMMKLNMSIIYANMNISRIEDSLPPLPSLDNINWLNNESSQLNNSLSLANDNYLKLLELYRELNNSFAGIQSDYVEIYMQLDAIDSNITTYLTELKDSLNNAETATNNANDDLTQAKSILADLRNFTNATSQLKSQADQALSLAGGINSTLASIEEVVSSNLSQLKLIANQLKEILADVNNLEIESIALQEESSSLLNSSLSLLDDSSALMTTFIDNGDTIDELYSDIVSTNSEINDVDKDLQDTKDVLYSDEIQELRTDALEYSTNASTIVSVLEGQVKEVSLVDEVFLQEVQAIVLNATNAVDSMSLFDLYNTLNTMYNDQDSELSMLNERIADMRERVNRLRQILDSLPAECDN